MKTPSKSTPSIEFNSSAQSYKKLNEKLEDLKGKNSKSFNIHLSDNQNEIL